MVSVEDAMLTFINYLLILFFSATRLLQSSTPAPSDPRKRRGRRADADELQEETLRGACLRLWPHEIDSSRLVLFHSRAMFLSRTRPFVRVCRRRFATSYWRQPRRGAPTACQGYSVLGEVLYGADPVLAALRAGKRDFFHRLFVLESGSNREIDNSR